MPMDFPDLDSLKRAAKVHGFSPIELGETEETYRERLADFVALRDIIESEEIRNKVGWDQFTDDQNLAMLRRQGAPPTTRRTR